jgi:transposase
VAHANARTTVYARRLIVERFLAGWPAARIAEQLGISRATVYKWINRYLAEGWAGLADRSSRPHHTPFRAPGELLHVDVNLGRVPDGGGWRLHGRSEEVRGRKIHGHGLGYDFLHAAVDDHPGCPTSKPCPMNAAPAAPASCAARRPGSPATACASSRS